MKYLDETKSDTRAMVFALVMSFVFLLLITPFILPLIGVMMAGLKAKRFVNRKR